MGKNKDIRKVALTVDTLTRFRKAERAVKAAEIEASTLKAEVADLGKNEIMAENCRVGSFVSQSVRLVDSNGEEAVVTWMDKYSKVGGDKVKLVETAFAFAGLDVNLFVRETVDCKFDGSVLFDGDEFNRKMYDEMLQVVTAVAKKYGKDCPLTITPVVAVRDNFNEERWSKVKLADHPAISAVLPNTVTVK